MDVTGLKSKEFRETVDKAGRWLLYSFTSLGACVLAAVGLLVGKVDWEVASAFPPACVAAMAAVEFGITMRRNKKEKR